MYYGLADFRHSLRILLVVCIYNIALIVLPIFFGFWRILLLHYLCIFTFYLYLCNLCCPAKVERGRRWREWVDLRHRSPRIQKQSWLMGAEQTLKVFNARGKMSLSSLSYYTHTHTHTPVKAALTWLITLLADSSCYYYYCYTHIHTHFSSCHVNQR